MGQTLPNGIYLPAEGERNCYDGLEGNWRSLDSLISTVAGKASATHTHGNISNDGKVGTTANKPLITGTGGAVQAGSFGNQANTFCEGNDSRLSDARTPVAHTHGKADITDLLNSNFIPSANNSYDLGSSSYQWNKIYSADVVHTSGNETIGGNKIFTGTNKVTDLLPSQNGGALGNASLLHFNGFFEGVYVFDQIKVNGDRGAWIVPVWSDATSGIQILTADGIKPVQIGVATTGTNNRIVLDTSKGYVNFYTGSTGTDNKVEFYPANTDISNLGTSTNKWKSLNGVNPGALSLPNGNAQDTSWIGDLTIKDGSNYNLKTFALNGWITINIPNTAGNLVVVNNGCGQIITNEANGITGNNCAVFMPVVANVQISILLVLQTGESVKTAIFAPCLGNV